MCLKILEAKPRSSTGAVCALNHWGICLSFLSTAVDEHHDQNDLERKGFVSVCRSQLTACQWKKSEQGLKQRLWRNAAHLLVSQTHIHLPFMHLSGPSAQEWHCPQRAEPSCINHQSIKWPIDLPVGQSSRCIGWGSLFPMTVGSVKMTKKKSTPSLQPPKEDCMVLGSLHSNDYLHIKWSGCVCLCVLPYKQHNLQAT